MTKEKPEHAAALLERIGRLLTVEAHLEGLRPVQWEVLRYLERANRFSTAPHAVTAYLGITKGTLSQTLATLENKGLIKRRVDASDRRSKSLSLTGKGRGLLARDPLRQLEETIAGLGDARVKQLSRSLETLLSNRLTQQDRQPFGQCRDCRFFSGRHVEGKPHYCLLLEETLSESDAAAICVEQQPGSG